MLTGVTPFRAANDYQMMKKIRNLEYTFPEGFDPEAKDIVTRLLVSSVFSYLNPTLQTNDPDERYTMVDLKAHSFFRGLNWETVGEREPPPAYTYIRVKIGKNHLVIGVNCLLQIVLMSLPTGLIFLPDSTHKLLLNY